MSKLIRSRSDYHSPFQQMMLSCPSIFVSSDYITHESSPQIVFLPGRFHLPILITVSQNTMVEIEPDHQSILGWIGKSFGSNFYRFNPNRFSFQVIPSLFSNERLFCFPEIIFRFLNFQGYLLLSQTSPGYWPRPTCKK